MDGVAVTVAVQPSTDARIAACPASRNLSPAERKWTLGDYGRIGVTLQITGELLCEAMDLRAGERVLDVAAGNGNATLAAARRGCRVVSTDCVPALLEQSAARAAAEGAQVDYRIADAECLPYDDGSFDCAVSTFGVMFVHQPEQAASELLRVTREGGRIGMTHWTPDGFVGQLFATVGAFTGRASQPTPAQNWGREENLVGLFAGGGRRIDSRTRWFAFRYRSADHWLDVFKHYYGPLRQAFDALDPSTHESLESLLRRLLDRFNRATDGTLVVPSSYLEVVISR